MGGVDDGDRVAVDRRGRPVVGSPEDHPGRGGRHGENRHDGRCQTGSQPDARRRHVLVGPGLVGRAVRVRRRAAGSPAQARAAPRRARYRARRRAAAGRRGSARARPPAGRCGRGPASAARGVLVERLGCDRALQLRDQLVVAAERKGDVDALRSRGAALVVQPRRRRAGVALERDVRQRRAAPQAERLVEPVQRCIELVRCRRRPRLGEKLGEPRSVQLAGVRLDGVARERGWRSPTRRRARRGAARRTRAPCASRSRVPARPTLSRSASRPIRPRRRGGAGRRAAPAPAGSAGPRGDRRRVPRAVRGCGR